MLKSVTDADFDREVLEQGRAVLVDFWASWCGPCKAMAPILDVLARDYEGVVDIAKINVDQNGDVRDRFGINGLPTLALFRDGREVARLLGVQSRTKLNAFLDANLDGEARRPDPAAGAAVPTRAFGGDAAVKAACIARLEEYVAHGTSLSETAEEDDPGIQPLCLATEQMMPEAVAGSLGVPLPLVPAIDILATYYGTAVAGGAFVLAWLRSVPVGADLSGLPRDLLLAVLESKEVREASVSSEGFADLHRQIVSTHRENPGFAEWARLREAVGKRIIGKEGFLRMLGTCLQRACWPCTDPDVVAQTISSAAFIPATRVSQEMGWTRAEQKIADTLLKESAEVLIAERGSPIGALDRVARDNPEIAERFKAHSNGYYDAMRNFGQFVGQALLNLTRKAVLNLK